MVYWTWALLFPQNLLTPAPPYVPIVQLREQTTT